MMTLVVDVGNTNIAIGLHIEGKWQGDWRVQTSADRTEDEYLILFHTILAQNNVPPVTITRAVLSSVVPSLTSVLTNVLKQLSQQQPLIINHTLHTGLKHPIPAELGNDLLANAAAAFAQYKKAAVVVDFGTALTFIAVSAKGKVLGVNIAPGLRSAVSVLSSNTAQLPMVELSMPPTALACNTVHAIQAGIVHGYVGLIKEILARMTEEMQTTPVIIATGGLAKTFAPIVGCFDCINQKHTLEGLLLLSEKNPVQHKE